MRKVAPLAAKLWSNIPERTAPNLTMGLRLPEQGERMKTAFLLANVV